jgi:hypothetical protein
VNVQVSTEALQVLVMPFYQILVSSDDSRLFRKVIGGVVKRILNALIPSEDGGAPQLPNVDMRPLLKDMFLIAASPYGCGFTSLSLLLSCVGMVCVDLLTVIHKAATGSRSMQ